MKSRFEVLFVVACGSTAAVFGVPNAQAQEKCTQATLKGGYGHLITGTRFDFEGALAVNHGTVVFDVKGHYSLPTDTVTINGVVTRYTDLNGPYRDNENCSGTIYNQDG